MKRVSVIFLLTIICLNATSHRINPQQKQNKQYIQVKQEEGEVAPEVPVEGEVEPVVEGEVGAEEGVPAEGGEVPAEGGEPAPEEGGLPPAEEGGEPPAEEGGEAPAEEGGEAPAEEGGEAPAEEGGEAPAEEGGEPPAEEGAPAPEEGGEAPAEGGEEDDPLQCNCNCNCGVLEGEEEGEEEEEDEGSNLPEVDESDPCFITCGMGYCYEECGACLDPDPDTECPVACHQCESCVECWKVRGDPCADYCGVVVDEEFQYGFCYDNCGEGCLDDDINTFCDPKCDQCHGCQICWCREDDAFCPQHLQTSNGESEPIAIELTR